MSLLYIGIGIGAAAGIAAIALIFAWRSLQSGDRPSAALRVAAGVACSVVVIGVVVPVSISTLRSQGSVGFSPPTAVTPPPTIDESPPSPSAQPSAPLTNGSGGPPPAGNPEGPSRDEELQAFLENCESSVGEWRIGQVSYLKSLEIQLGDTASYPVAVDMRTSPAPPGEALHVPEGEAQADQAAFQCAVVARLTPSSTALEVVQKDWIPRVFPLTGVADWTWDVKATKLEELDLKLELTPAVAVQGGYEVVVTSGTTSPHAALFRTQLVVKGDVPQNFEDQWSKWNPTGPIIAGIGAALAVAILGLVKFWGSIGEALRESREKWRRDS